MDEFLSWIWFTTPSLQSPLLSANVNLHLLLRNNISSMGVGHSFPNPFIKFYSNIYAKIDHVGHAHIVHTHGRWQLSWLGYFKSKFPVKSLAVSFSGKLSGQQGSRPEIVFMSRVCSLCVMVCICDLFLVTTLRYAASDNFNYLRGCLTLLPNTFHGLLPQLIMSLIRVAWWAKKSCKTTMMHLESMKITMYNCTYM